MGKRLRAALIATNLTVFAAAAGLIGLGMHRLDRSESAYGKRVLEKLEEYKACPERIRKVPYCYSPKEKYKKLSEAEMKEKLGKYEEAGMIYASLLDGRAKDMAEICRRKGDEKGWKNVLDELSAREEARRRFLGNE